MARSGSPYDRRDKFMESGAAVKMASKAGLLSMGLHLAVIWVFLFLAPNLFVPDSRPSAEPPFRVRMIEGDNPALLVNNQDVTPGQTTAGREGAETTASDSTSVQWENVISQKDIPDVNTVIDAPTVTLENLTSELRPRSTKPPAVDVTKVKPDKPVQDGGQTVDPKGRLDTDEKGETTNDSGSDDGLWIDPEQARYYAALQGLVRRNWSWISTVSMADRELETILEVVIQPDGRISFVQMLASSGNEGFDRSIIRAIRASNPFPVLPPIFGGQATTVVFSFKPLEMLKLQTQ